MVDRAATRKGLNTSHKKAQCLGHFCRAGVSEVVHFFNFLSKTIQHSWAAQDGSHRRYLGLTREIKHSTRTGTNKSTLGSVYSLPNPGGSQDTRISLFHYYTSTFIQLLTKKPKSLALISLEKVSLPLLSAYPCAGLADPPAGENHPPNPHTKGDRTIIQSSIRYHILLFPCHFCLIQHKE